VVAQPVSTDALVALAAAVDVEAGLPGVTGAIPEVETFATAWKSRTGAAPLLRMAQRIYKRWGYGGAVTATVSAERLAAGRQFCFLYTDLANPTSNRIYLNIGYEPVCDSLDYAFDPG